MVQESGPRQKVVARCFKGGDDLHMVSERGAAVIGPQIDLPLTAGGVPRIVDRLRGRAS
jgi:hypothetical protein